MVGRLCSLREEVQSPAAHHHPSGGRSHAADYRYLCRLLQVKKKNCTSHNALELFVWVNVSCHELVNSSHHLCVGGRASRQSESTRKWSISWRIWRRVFATAAKKSSQVTYARIFPLPWQRGVFSMARKQNTDESTSKSRIYRSQCVCFLWIIFSAKACYRHPTLKLADLSN